MRKCLVLAFFAAAALITLVGTPTAHAYPLLAGLGGPAGYGVYSLPSDVDISSDAIDLTGAFRSGLHYYSRVYSAVYVNNDGTITFHAAAPTYSVTPFPVVATDENPMMAPYRGNVDTRRYFTRPPDDTVYWDVRPGQFVVTWHNVGVFFQHDDHLMDFQLIITSPLDCSSGDFQVEFRYNRCGWTLPSTSVDTGSQPFPPPFGTTYPTAGFDSGNGVDYIELPGSRTPNVVSLCTTSNVSPSTPGLWRFTLHNGTVVCPGTGERCTVPNAHGVCGLGITSCIGQTTECVPIGKMTGERCDGIDNDCDGNIDDNALCSGSRICTNGECVSPCFEHSCLDGETCTADGTCVDTACIGVTCPDNQNCVGGICGDACAGVVCPHGQECIAGRCIDLCSVLRCGTGEVCENGQCIPTCPCHACASNEYCTEDGRCKPAACELAACPDGDYCTQDGTCVDTCSETICPTRQHCDTGECVDDQPSAPDAGTRSSDAGQPDAGVDASIDAGTVRHYTGGGCCSVGGADSPTSSGLLASLVLGLVAVTRRRAHR